MSAGLEDLDCVSDDDASQLAGDDVEFDSETGYDSVGGNDGCQIVKLALHQKSFGYDSEFDVNQLVDGSDKMDPKVGERLDLIAVAAGYQEDQDGDEGIVGAQDDAGGMDQTTADGYDVADEIVEIQSG